MNIAVLLKSFINIIIGIAVVILGLRFIFRLFNANSNNALVDWIYSSSAEIMTPFRGIFPTSNIEGSVVDFSALFAVFMYALIGFFVIYVIDSLTASAERSKKR